MAMMDDQDRKRLFSFFYEAFDDENAGTMDAFAQNFLHNAAVFDLIADHFPNATVSAVRQAMMEAYGAWKQGCADQ